MMFLFDFVSLSCSPEFVFLNFCVFQVVELLRYEKMLQDEQAKARLRKQPGLEMVLGVAGMALKQL